MPTEEEWLAMRAYHNILDATKFMPLDERAAIRGRVARNLIRKVRDGENGLKQSLEMWRVFHRRLPKYVTDADRPA